MSYTIQVLDKEAIVIVTLHKDFDFASEGVSSTEEAKHVLDQQPQPVYYISDMTAIRFSMEETIEGSNMAARDENGIFHHKNIRQIIFIIGDIFQELTAQGMESDLFGRLQIKTFSHVDDALAWIRSQ